MNRVDPDAEVAQLIEVAAEVIAAVKGQRVPTTMTGGHAGQYRLDVLAHELGVQRLGAAGYAVMSEEDPKVPDGERLVVIDPVDGSTNAARGLWPWAVSMAVFDSGELNAGVVCASDGQVWWARNGEGAWSGGRRLSVARTELERCIVGVNGVVVGPWWQQRSLGCVSVELALLASGALDGYVSAVSGHGLWDYAAGALLVREAGGIVMDIAGRDLFEMAHGERRQLVAASSSELSVVLRAAIEGNHGE